MTKALNRLIKDIIQNRKVILIVLLIWGGVVLVFHKFCPMVLLTGLPCPGCGLTRAFFSFLTLHPMEALTYNATSVLWIAFILYAFWNRYVCDRKIKGFGIILGILLIITIGYYLWRMAHFFPGVGTMAYFENNYLAHMIPDYKHLISVIFDSLN
ncbi:DUF2752 domain-containing protein [Butyrivibrio sp. WCD3002]|uniref:DUF2752 domain-containing protein n=1 Tax=Butyrivibrio sp. WCD3002 TaxID=1280676 RepID=UPI000561D468|nr:DUF2752 domain-containing protein [Butyrivibrio sp. WCD3002]